jgi:transcriptional regulator with XRE-family HTH domain
MNNTQKLLLRVLDRVPRNSKDGLAKAIGANRSNVRLYLKGERYPNAAHALKIAEILGMEAKEVILYIQEDKTKNPEQKEILKRNLPRLHSAAAIALALRRINFWRLSDSRGSADNRRTFSLPDSILCEVLNTSFPHNADNLTGSSAPARPAPSCCGPSMHRESDRWASDLTLLLDNRHSGH